ncbi:MAG TPA: glycosyl hydrolase family 28-related protein [Planctomycetota bacterium]|nr:glycosyl hydrolase family 28-related protein [Planctomycetota bacterium]
MNRHLRILARIAFAVLVLPQILGCGGGSKSTKSAPPSGPTSPAPAPTPPGQILPADRSTDWDLAGIPGGIVARSGIGATVNAATYGNGTTDATSAIQNAINACPSGQVVYLPAGTYVTTQPINLKSNITLRGAGPGQTILRYQGTGARAVLEMYGYVWSEIDSVRWIVPVTGGMAKDSRQITVSSASGFSVGDVLLIDQLNDGVLVDINGFEGACTYCSRENGARARGMFAQITSISGNTLVLNLPLYWSLNPALSPVAVRVRSNSWLRWCGVEELSVSEAQANVEYLIEVQGAQYCWLKRVDISRMNRRGVWSVLSLQNEVRECTIRDSIGGYGHDHGYGVQLDGQTTATLVENNIFRTIGSGGAMTSGGAVGNVVAYNYLFDMRYDDPTWNAMGPYINHAPHPSMNLFEGNIGPGLAADFIHGSSSHNTVFRSRSTGWINSTMVYGNSAITLNYKNTSFSVIGCVLGTASKTTVYELAPPGSDNSAASVVWRLGFAGPNWATDPNVKATLLRHGNWDSVTNGVVWDPGISTHTLPASLYLSGKPSWWGSSLPWPPIGPDVSPVSNKIPAQVRYESGGY